MNAASANSSNAPIGIFDSGYGGLTVLREVIARMPNESTIFVGDSAHFPYGPKDLSEVRSFVLGICEYLVGRGCKMIIIACNTATAAGLAEAQRRFNVPVIGVVEPGSRAAVHMTRTRKVGVIATEGTVSTGAYANAIHSLDAGIKVTSVATPKFVDIAEAGLQFYLESDVDLEGYYIPEGERPSLIVSDRGVLDCDSGPVYEKIAKEYLTPLHDEGIDTLVLGCTHFPLIQTLIQEGIGEGVALVSSAEETAREVFEVLRRRGQLAGSDNEPVHEYFTTGKTTAEFSAFGELVMGGKIGPVELLDIW